jgi:PKD repeat protein
LRINRDMTKKLAVTLAAILGSVSCTVHKTEAPSLSGPSEFALSILMTATPDSISQDGSQSSVKIAARGPDGRALTSLPMRVEMMLDGVPQDFGTLSARTIVTGSDGVASVIYTAPRQNQSANGGQCPGLAGTCVTIVATAIGTNFQAVNPQIVTIRLVPPGVILPPAGSPTAAFTVTPSTVSVDVPTVFDASNSTAGQNSSELTSFSWNFGDGTAMGRTVTHTFTTGGTFNVTLTVTNDRGLSASSTQAIVVSATDPFTGDWTFSPTTPLENEAVVFNATPVQSSAGHQVVQYTWDFGDPNDREPKSGVVTSHSFAKANTYNVVLTVVDDLGRKKVFIPKALPVVVPKP